MNAAFSRPSVTQRKIARWTSARQLDVREDELVIEEPLEIRVRGKAIAVTMRTPGHDDELAAGFLFSEGLISKGVEILEIAYCPRAQSPDGENILNVILSPSVSVDFSKLTRHVFASSSCGVCGKGTIESVHQSFPSLQGTPVWKREILDQLPDKLRSAQKNFDRTGGLHAAAVFDADGNLILVREDVGRHNAVDKVIGHGLMKGHLPYDQHLLMVSGRASFEIMQKALAARFPLVVAVSAPSSLAVQFAEESGQTLVGFLRGETFNIYAHPEKIQGFT